MWISALIQGVVSLGKGWIDKKREESQAKHTAKIKRIEQEGDWDETMAKGSLTSWKDEYLTIIFTTPFVLLFISALFNLPELTTRVIKAFEVIDQDVPEEYWYVLGVIVAASFGVRKVIDGIQAFRSK